MNLDEFTQYVSTIRDRAKLLYRRSLDPDPSELLPDTLQELQVAMEELRVAEEELRQQNDELMESRLILEVEQRRYQDLFELAPDGYLVTDTSGVIREANQAVAQLLGHDSQRLVDKPLAAFVEMGDRPLFRMMLAQLAQSPTDSEWDARLTRHRGEPFDAALTVSSRSHDDGQSLVLYWMVRDVTAQKQAQQQLLALNAELMQRSALEGALWQISQRLRESLEVEQILQIATQDLTKTLNLLACDAALYDLPHHQSTIWLSYTDPNSPIAPSHPGVVAMNTFAEGYTQLLDGQVLQFCERSDNPVRQTVSILACPIQDHQDSLGDLWCFSPVDRSLTAHQVYLVQQVANQCAIALRQARLHQESQRQMAELQRLNSLKDNFLSAVSHELRTPLTNIKMALHVLPLAKSDAHRATCLRILQTECDREIDLITDLLELQQLEAEQYPHFLLEAIVLSDWLPMILAPFWRRVEAQHQTLTVAIPDGLPPVITDQASLRRVLVELVRNAQKHTPSGGSIAVEVDYSPGSASIRFTLRNQATIPAPELNHIFDKFHRAYLGHSPVGGMGLGLALVRQLVERLQGAIAVESQDSWTTFSLTLPLRLQRSP